MISNRQLARAAFASLLIASSTQAAQSYDDANALNTWNATDLNWLTGAAWANTLTSDAIFAGTGESVAVTTVNARDITFNSTGYTLTGSTITLGATSNITVTNLADTATIASILAGAGTSLTKSGAGKLTLSGANGFSGETIVSNGTLFLNVATGTLAGTSKITVNNGGIMEFGGGSTSNKSSGKDSIGTNSKAIVVNTGGTLKTSTYNPMGYNNLNNFANITLSGGTFNIASEWSYVGSVTLNTGGSVTGAGAMAFWYTPTSPTTAIMANDDASIASKIHINDVNQTITVADTKTLTISGVISNYDGSTGATSTTKSGIVKAGLGTLTLSNANVYGGITTVSAGTIKLGHNNALGGTSTGTSVSSGAVLDLNGRTVGAEALTLNGTGISSGGALINSSATAASLSGAVTLNAASSVGGTGNITLSGAVGGSGLTKVGAGTLTLSNASNSHAGTTVSGGILSIGAAANLGSGALSFTSVGTGLTVTGTAVTLANTIALPTSGTGNVTLLTPDNSSTVFNGTLSGGAAGVTLFFQGGATGQNSGALTLNGNNTGLLGTINVQRGPLILGNANAAGSTQILLDSNNNANGALQLAGNFTIANNVKINYLSQRIGVGTGLSAGISGVISENAGNGLEKVGAGVLTLTNTNTYNGATLVSAGTLALGHATDTLSSSSAVTVDGATAVLSIGGNSDTVGAVSLKNGGSITGTGGTLTGASFAVESGSISAKLGGSGVALTKSTTGTVTLSGDNSYTGATTVNAGTLVVNGNQSTATGAVTVSNAGTRLMGIGTIGGNTTINADAIHSAGSATGAVGTQAFSGDLTYASGAIFEWDINANANTGAGTNFDSVAVTGAANAATGSIFKVVFGGGVDLADAFWSTPYVTQTWNMAAIFGASFTGSFTSVQTTADPVTQGSFSINGTSLTWTAVPEPSGALVGALITLGLYRRKRRG